MAHHPSVYITWPTIFSPIPDSLPLTVPSPVRERTIRAPFGIDKDLFNFALRPEIPITFASLYIIGVFSLNAYNRSRDHKPWSVSKTAAFKYFVVVHNVLLSLYSFATFAAMFRAIVHTWPEGGWSNVNSPAAVADALCKLHGPRGIGDAATYNTTINIWEAKNALIKLGYDGNPDPTDVGRLWNEGLAFWGWIFYVSKFYEVIDTLIILAKGKRSATLQTYHHAGAMLCMWAGIRYMSPPIWMFVFINSGIHAMMYTYFTLSALGYKVPQSLKRTLTSLQIAQFVFGASYAAAHLFVQYDIPIQVPYQVVSTIERAVSSASSAASAASSTVSEFVETPTIAAPHNMGSFIKKLLLRAAGEEGVAERVAMETSTPLASAALGAASQAKDDVQRYIEQKFETRYHDEWAKINCIDTTGEAFAIYLNLLYLAPLTFLFARFFVRAYTQRGKPRSARDAADSAREAQRDTKDSIEGAGVEAEDELRKRGTQAQGKGQELHEQLRKDVQAIKSGNFGGRRVSDRVHSFEGKVKTAGEKAKDGVKRVVNGKEGSGSSTQGKNQGEGESAIEDEQGEGAEEDSIKSKAGAGPSEKKNGGGSGGGGKKGRSKGNTASQEKKDDKQAASADIPKETQDKALADSQATRPGVGVSTEAAGPEGSVDSVDKAPEASEYKQSGGRDAKGKEDDETYADVIKRDDDDTDAMGKSGIEVPQGKEGEEGGEKAT